MKKAIKTPLACLAVGVSSVAMAQIPPNTIDLGALNSLSAQSYYATGNIPTAVQQAPLSVQPLLVPNMASQVQQEIQAYKSENLSADQLRELKQFTEERERVSSLPYSSTPTPVNRSVSVSLAPDAQLPIIRLAKDMLTTIAFTDEDGTPWEVEKVSVNAQLFTNHTEQPGMSAPVEAVQPAQPAQMQTTVRETTNPDGTITREEVQTPVATQNTQPVAPTRTFSTRPNNIVSLEPNTTFGFSNLVITLKGKPTPLVFVLTSGQPEVDMLVSARVGGVNPDRKYNPLTGSRLSVDTTIDESALQFLDGRTPTEATELISSDGAVQAWELNDKLFVKTRLNVLYPAYTAKASMDGIHVYRFNSLSKAKIVTFMQRAGQPVNVQFSQTPYYLR